MSSEDHPTAVPCPKCDYDLRGQTEPRCPECGLDFGSFETLADAVEWDRQRVPELARARVRAAWWLVGGCGLLLLWMGIYALLPEDPAEWTQLGLLVLPASCVPAAGVLWRVFLALGEPRIPPADRAKLWSSLLILMAFCLPLALTLLICLLGLLR